MAVFHPPELRPVVFGQQKQSAAVRDLARLRRLDRRRSQLPRIRRHADTPNLALDTPQRDTDTPKLAGLQWDTAKLQATKNPPDWRVFRGFMDPWGIV